jgi:hypothetical protein
MQIEDFKRWHWALLGILAGLIFAYAWQDHDVAGDKAYDMAEIKQNMFERYALSKSSESGQAILQNVRVEPPVKDYENRDRQIVTGKRLRFNPQDKKEYLVPFYFYSSIPYKPHLLPPGVQPLAKDATVMDFLAVAKKANPPLQYRFVWEYQSNWYIVLWAAGGLVVIGGIWPTVLNLLLGAGLGRPRKTSEDKANEDYLRRFGKGAKEAQPALAAKGATDADRDRLDEMNAALESQLAGAGVLTDKSTSPETDDDSVVAARSDFSIAPLNAEPAEEIPIGAQVEHEETEEERRRRFAAGDFYPVARGNKKD